MWQEIRALKKVRFGGYDKKAVVDYIKIVSKEFIEYKVFTENAFQEINFKLAKLNIGKTTALDLDVGSREFSVAEMMKSRETLKNTLAEINFKLDELVKETAQTKPIDDEEEKAKFISNLISQADMEEAVDEEFNSIDAFFEQLESEDMDFNIDSNI